MLKKALLCSAVTLMAASHSFADNTLSAELMVGKSSLELVSKEIDYDYGDTTSFGARVGYAMWENIVLEVGYQDYGEVEESSFLIYDGEVESYEETISASALNFSVKALLPLGSDFSLFGRLGLAMWEIEYSFNDVNFATTYDSNYDGEDLFYGFGVEYELNDQFIFGTEYSMVKMGLSSDGDSGDFEVSTLSFTAGMKF